MLHGQILDFICSRMQIHAKTGDPIGFVIKESSTFVFI